MMEPARQAAGPHTLTSCLPHAAVFLNGHETRCRVLHLKTCTSGTQTNTDEALKPVGMWFPCSSVLKGSEFLGWKIVLCIFGMSMLLCAEGPSWLIKPQGPLHCCAACHMRLWFYIGQEICCGARSIQELPSWHLIIGSCPVLTLIWGCGPPTAKAQGAKSCCVHVHLHCNFPLRCCLVKIHPVLPCAEITSISMRVCSSGLL